MSSSAAVFTCSSDTLVNFYGRRTAQLNSFSRGGPARSAAQSPKNRACPALMNLSEQKKSFVDNRTSFGPRYPLRHRTRGCAAANGSIAWLVTFTVRFPGPSSSSFLAAWSHSPGPPRWHSRAWPTARFFGSDLAPQCATDVASCWRKIFSDRHVSPDSPAHEQEASEGA
jgi:hypothetical protein